MTTRFRSVCLIIPLCAACILGLAACNDEACRTALQKRDKRINELQLAVVKYKNQMASLRSVLQMKQKEVGVYKDRPVTSSDAYQTCRRRADRLQAQLKVVTRERNEYKQRYLALKKRTTQ